jgi:cellobiose phosphorylase
VVKGDSLEVNPCIPTDWPGYAMTLRYRGAIYEFTVRNPSGIGRGVVAITMDGKNHHVSQGRATLTLNDKNGVHCVDVTLGQS